MSMLRLQYKEIEKYLECSDIIDFKSCKDTQIESLQLIDGCNNEIEIIKKVYEFVRDDIKHSADIDGKIVTCKASEVLKYRQGICYAKSHLLAAMLRFLGIPTGLCYQKLVLDDDTAPYIILHGLNAVFVRDLGRWIRLDARGNKEGIDAQFSTEYERLAFPVRREKGEEDIWTIFSNPDKSVIDRLSQYDDPLELYNNLPSKLSETVNYKF